MTQPSRTSQTPRPILGLKVGKRTLGYAILHGGDLQLFGVRGLYRRSVGDRQREAAKFVGRLIDGFSPTIVAIDAPDGGTVDPSAATIRTDLTALTNARGMVVRSLSPSVVCKAVVGEIDAGKDEVSARIAEWFPYVERYLRIDLRTGKVYWRKMLEAVALAWTAHEERQRATVLRALRSRNQDFQGR
jgi:hypothetical protein